MAYHPKKLRFLSRMQILFGFILFGLGISSVMFQTDFTSLIGFGILALEYGSESGYGLQASWECLGAVINKYQTSARKLGTFMGFTITACVMAGTMIICHSIALAGVAACIRERQEGNRYTTYYYRSSSSRFPCYDLYNYYEAGIDIGSVSLIVAVLEFALGLASSIYCCAAICSCCNGTSRVQGTQQVVYPQPKAPSQVSTASGVVVMSGDPPSTVNVVKQPEGHFIVQQPLELRKEQEAPHAYN